MIEKSRRVRLLETFSRRIYCTGTYIGDMAILSSADVPLSLLHMHSQFESIDMIIQ